MYDIKIHLTFPILFHLESNSLKIHFTYSPTKNNLFSKVEIHFMCHI